MREEDDDLLRAAEELGIDLSGVRATDGQAADEATDDAEPARLRARRPRSRTGSRDRGLSADDFDAEPTATTRYSKRR